MRLFKVAGRGRRVLCSVLVLALILPLPVLVAAQSEDTRALEAEDDEEELDELEDEEETDEEDDEEPETSVVTPAPGPAPQTEAAAPAQTVTPEEPEEVLEDAQEDADEDIVEVFPEGVVNRGDDATIALTEEEIAELLTALGPDIDPARAGVVLNAWSLVEQVSYFWGGKSTELGWDECWGNPAYVTSGGSSRTGTLQTYGLDCSGYVDWVFTNAAGYDVSEEVGHGTTGQWNLSQPVDDWADAQPGDLAFFYDPAVAGSMNHVGVVMGWDEEYGLLVAHCASSAGTVIVTPAEETGFRYIRTPDIYEDEDFTAWASVYKGLDNVILWHSGEEVAEAQVGDIVFTKAPQWGGDQVWSGRVVRVKGELIFVNWGDDEDPDIQILSQGQFPTVRPTA